MDEILGKKNKLKSGVIGYRLQNSREKLGK
jgi:hypothetical protein